MLNLLSSLLLVIGHFFPVQNGHSLSITVNGFSSNEGKAFIAIYRPQDNFPAANGQFKGKVVPITNRTSKVVFEQLSDGDYAVAVYHDENKNGVLDKNFLGVPTEKYGFSNNARETFSAPSFEKAAVSVNKDRAIAIWIK